MSRLLQNNLGYLNLLAHSSPEQRDYLLATATPEQVHTLCEVCYNIGRGVLPVSNERWKRLKDLRGDIRRLSNSNVPFITKKQIIAQRGDGFIDDVIPPLLTANGLFL